MSNPTYSPEQWRTYQKARRDRLVPLMHEILGGCCYKCGATENLEIHHVFPERKSFDPTRCSRAWDAILDELTKCELRCEPCHRQEHYAKHGTLARYTNHGCRCAACTGVYKPWKAAVDRRYWAKKKYDNQKLQLP